MAHDKTKACRQCNANFYCDEDSEEYGTGLCPHCFEAGMEDFEERRRERIARDNEY